MHSKCYANSFVIKVKRIHNIEFIFSAHSSEDEEPESVNPVENNKKVAKSSVQQKSSSPEDNSETESSGGSDEDDESDESIEDEENETKTDAEIKKEKAWQRILVKWIRFLLEL